MVVGLLAVLGSAVCYGVASVLQAVGARRAPRRPTADASDRGHRSGGGRRLVGTLREAPFLAGIALDGVGWLLQVLALRSLPLFVVQAGQAANLAVTAVVAVPVLGARPGRRQWYAVAAICVGLALLAASAGAEHPVRPGRWFGPGLLAGTLVLVGCGLLAVRSASRRRTLGAAVLGSVAGLGYGVTALAARGLADLSTGVIGRLVREPAAWALAVGAVTGFLFFAAGLHAGSVTAVSAAVVVTETAVPAAVGVLVLGDHPRPGFAPVAAVGFGLAVVGALTLARYGEPPGRQNAPRDGRSTDRQGRA